MRSWCKSINSNWLQLINCNQLIWLIDPSRSESFRKEGIIFCEYRSRSAFWIFRCAWKKSPSSNMSVSCYSRVWLTASRRASGNIEGSAVMDRPDRGDWLRSFADADIHIHRLPLDYSQNFPIAQCGISFRGNESIIFSRWRVSCFESSADKYDGNFVSSISSVCAK